VIVAVLIGAMLIGAVLIVRLRGRRRTSAHCHLIGFREASKQ